MRELITEIYLEGRSDKICCGIGIGLERKMSPRFCGVIYCNSNLERNEFVKIS